MSPEPMHDLVATVAAPACLLGDRDGQIRPAGVAGLYVCDLRVLHGAQLSMDGIAPTGLGWAATGPNSTMFNGIVGGIGDESPDPTVRVDRTRIVRPDGIDEAIRIRSTAAAPIRTTISLRITPDLTPLTTIREGREGAPLTASVHADALTWSLAGVTVETAAVGAELDARTCTAVWGIDLGFGEEITLRWSVRVRDHASPMVAAHGPTGWSSPVVTAADPRFGRLLERSLEDLASLRLADAASPDDTFIAAGSPWFMTLFGRDSIWTARMMLPLGTGLAETTLRALASHQGTRVDVASCEEPGKIMHELRRDSVGLWPAAPSNGGPAVYYGTIDATLLWINLLADAWRWGMPDDVTAGFLPALRKALGWLADYSDPVGSGFISYLDRTGRGLANQGWKDSGTAVRFRDGAMATPPIALCEVQAYAHRAALDAAELLEAFGEAPSEAARWRDYAARLADRFRQRFWVDGPLGRHPALALDRDGRPVDSLTSNIGHLLGTGLLTKDEASMVARLLGTPALAGGYGLRTMSDLDAAFDPMSYHCGAVWPHDTAIALLGLATMPGDADARATAAILTDGLLAAAEAFDYRLPEMFSGDSRADTGRPLPHPAACRPQAWSVAAGVALLQTALGISAHGPHGVRATPLIPRMRAVGNLRFAGLPLEVAIDAEGQPQTSHHVD
jgi:glycogen debranching enzyme